MIDVDIQIDGMDELFASLDAMKSVSIVNKALRAGGEVIQHAIEEAAPENTTYEDGSNALYPGALKHDVLLSLKNGRSGDSSKKPTAVITFGKHTKHVARWLEFGFRHVKAVAGYRRGDNRKLQKRGKELMGKFVQKPFFRAAVDASKAQAAEVITDVLGAEINKAFKSGSAESSGE